MGRAQGCFRGHYSMLSGRPSTLCTMFSQGPWADLRQDFHGPIYLPLAPSTEGQGVGAVVLNLGLTTSLANLYLYIQKCLHYES